MPPVTTTTATRGPKRWLLVGIGSLAMVLGALGAVIPLLPTTPFVLVAAACFSRSSPRLHNRLKSSRLFGPLIENWAETRSVTMRAKVTAVSLIGIVGGTSVIWFIEPLWAQLTVAAVLSTVAVWLILRPTA